MPNVGGGQFFFFLHYIRRVGGRSYRASSPGSVTVSGDRALADRRRRSPLFVVGRVGRAIRAIQVGIVIIIGNII